MAQDWLSALERESRSPISRFIRSPSSWIWERNCSCFLGGVPLRAEVLERMTARGVRSSWEAAAINWFCFFCPSSRGCISLRVKNQEKIQRRRTPQPAAPKKSIRLRSTCSLSLSRGYTTVAERLPDSLGRRDTAA